MYNDGWSETIGCAIPATTRDFIWRSGLHPFFAHLGPEGWLRGVQARGRSVADGDDLGLLLAYGADCIGAVGVQPVGGTLAAIQAGNDPVDIAATVPGRTLSGVQQKLLAYRDADGYAPSQHTDEPATHIAKFNSADLPTLVANEALSLQVARALLGPDEVTRAEVASLRGIPGITLLVERFDRRGDERLRLEDLAQVLIKPLGSGSTGKYDSSYEEAAEAIAAHSARPRIDLDRYFRLVTFNLAIGNADAHLKNFSLLERPEGLRLSPAYDIVNTLLYPFDRDTALAVGGKRRTFDTLDRPLLERFGTEIGLPRAAVSRALDQLARRLKSFKWPNVPLQSAPDDFRHRYRETVLEQAHRVLA